MVIEEQDFKLIPVSGDRFDLEVLCTINKGKSNERKEFKNVAYGVTLEYALKYVANFRITNKYDNSISLATYLKEYKDIISEISKLCQI